MSPDKLNDELLANTSAVRWRGLRLQSAAEQRRMNPALDRFMWASPTANSTQCFRGYRMSTDTEHSNLARGSLRLASHTAEEEDPKPKLPRQFVTFTFYRARPEWRLLSEADKERCRD